ncbi:S8 family peptidase [Desulfovirgula thermocuniculi]|uniref:S8 family peptidase n=1 Tax=Desulfovirgula thermocuniculi TaxID=348842 RepID=UPI000415908C|nr:S8 family peptidase [Desulfovirgula thermocuniculi]
MKKLNYIILFKEPAFEGTVLRDDLRSLLTGYGASRIEPLPLVNGVACYLPDGVHLQGLRKEEMVTAIESNLQVRLYPVWLEAKHAIIKEGYQVIPWGIHRIGADQAWSQADGEGVKVAVLDTGCDLHHPDLRDNLGEGKNILDPHLPPLDDHGHGTHISGIIAAVRNDFGIIGAAPGAKIYPVKVLDRRGKGSFADVIRGLQWCLEQNMRVINLSFGSNTGSKALHEAIRQVVRKGAVVVAAAGNDGTNHSVDYPAAYPEVIAVGATDEKDGLAPFSSQGKEIKLVAPGTNILSTKSGGSFWRLSGTSMAAPHVSGTVALLWSLAPGHSAGQITRILYGTAEKLPSLSSEQQGAGLVRADLACQKVHGAWSKGEEEGKEGENNGEEHAYPPKMPGFWPFPHKSTA